MGILKVYSHPEETHLTVGLLPSACRNCKAFPAWGAEYPGRLKIALLYEKECKFFNRGYYIIPPWRAR